MRNENDLIDHQRAEPTWTPPPPIATDPTRIDQSLEVNGEVIGSERKPVTKAIVIRMPGEEFPAASRLVIPKPPPTEPHLRNLARNTKPSASQAIRQAAEGLDYQFLRSQPRVLGPGSLRRARPRRSESNLNTHPQALNIKHAFNDSIRALQTYPAAGYKNHVFGHSRWLILR
jgi:hypothetical protein